MRSERGAARSSGYADRPRDFDDLMHILDRELRLITPTDPEGSSSESQAKRCRAGNTTSSPTITWFTRSATG